MPAGSVDAVHQAQRWWLMTAALLLIASGCLWLGFVGNHDALAGAVPYRPAPDAAVGVSPTAPIGGAPVGGASTGGASVGGAPTGAAQTAAAPTGGALTRGAPPVLQRSAPVGLSVPAIGVSVSVSQLALNPDKTVQVPTNFQEPGWYRLGPAPGELGSAVILGHVDSFRGPAVFFRLRYLRAGDAVAVSLADGATAHFVVTAVATYSKQSFPAQLVYAAHGGSSLQLVTCGGQFDTHTRSYLSNVVVYTSLVTTTPATGAS